MYCLCVQVLVDSTLETKFESSKSLEMFMQNMFLCYTKNIFCLLEVGVFNFVTMVSIEFL